MTDFAGTFDRHEIRDRVTAPHFGSWRLMRRTESGGWTGEFWCRITAADGLLRVSGDFEPIVFSGHLSNEDDPIARVAWMGAHEGLDGYVCEKARSGSGRDACTRWDGKLKLAHLAVQRLHVLLTVQAVTDAAAETANVPKHLLSLPEGYKHSLAGPVPLDVDTSAMTGAQVVAAMNLADGAEWYVWTGNAVRDTRDPTIAGSAGVLTFDVGAVPDDA